MSRASKEETQQLLAEINAELSRDDGALQYSHNVSLIEAGIFFYNKDTTVWIFVST